MEDIKFKGKFINDKGALEVNLKLLSFQEGAVHIIYSPHLDLAGYGETFEDAEESFKVVSEEYFEYIMNNGTIEEEMKKLGWSYAPKASKKSKIVLPGFSDLMKNNPYMSEIFDKHTQVVTFNQNFGIPVSA